MSELRKDYILDRYVIIATERSKRPDQFFKEQEKRDLTKTDYFAPGNENLTPKEIGRREDENGWYIRWFENKFPAVKEDGPYNVRTDNEFFTFSTAVGKHEVIVETPKIEDEISDLSVGHIKELFEIYRERVHELMKNPKIRYVSVFKNHLPAAGTSIVHTHSQIIAYNIVPTFVMDKVNKIKNFSYDPYSKVIEIEKRSHRRCFENESFISFTPYASRFPLEIWVFPKEYARTLDDFDDKKMNDLAEMMKLIFLSLRSIDAPFNYFLHYAPPGEEMRFHIEVCPRLATWAGFEMATETIINSVTPEEAAKFYRG
ncbi:galactose-1-phosphate uridylyltransferase [Desulfosarcina sp.]|nr:galactose-1-phosphate uridylyltransferase [Desulfosarcina sp.]